MSNNNPFFSIISPTFNRPKMLRRAIESVQNQTFNDWEHIIISDGCLKARDCVIGLKPDSRRSFYIFNHNHGRLEGPGVCRKKGLKFAKGVYVLYLDDDDYYKKDHLMNIWNALSDNDVDWAYTDAFFKIVNRVWKSKLRRGSIGTFGFVHKRDIEINWKRNGRVPEDWVAIDGLIKKKINMKYIPTSTYVVQGQPSGNPGGDYLN